MGVAITGTYFRVGISGLCVLGTLGLVSSDLGLVEMLVWVLLCGLVWYGGLVFVDLCFDAVDWVCGDDFDSLQGCFRGVFCAFLLGADLITGCVWILMLGF